MRPSFVDSEVLTYEFSHNPSGVGYSRVSGIINYHVSYCSKFAHVKHILNVDSSHASALSIVFTRVVSELARSIRNIQSILNIMG